MADVFFHNRPALANMIDALPAYGPFLTSLGQSTNSGDPESGAAWLLDFVSRWLDTMKLPAGPIKAFDHCIVDIEALDRVWPMLVNLEAELPVQSADTLPSLARFLVERMPAIWGGPSWVRHETVARALVMADRAHDLAALFAAGVRPTGSKDPYAQRRVAKHFLMQVMFPITAHKGAI